jgi:hypothetical protein
MFKKPLEVKFWRMTLIIEAAFCLHNCCIGSRESSIIVVGNCDPTTLTPTYMEYLDPLGDNPTLKSEWHAVHQALLQKIKSDGREWPCYSIVHNSLNVTVG